MVYYAVIDTNVLISAMLKWNSVPGNVLEFTFSGTIIPVLNEHIVRGQWKKKERNYVSQILKQKSTMLVTL